MPKGKVTVVNKLTGEIYDFDWADEESQAEAYANLSETITALERAKKKIREIVVADMDKRQLDHNKVGGGRFEWHKVISRYYNYDLRIMRNVLDEDLFNQIIKPNKTLIDKFLKESVADPEHAVIPADAGQALRDHMTEERPPSVALKLERSKDV